MTAKTLIPRLRLLLVQALWLLMALGPFLHAHYGASVGTGFHEDSIERVASLLEHSQRHALELQSLGTHTPHDLVLETSEQPESPAMVVGSSLSRLKKPSLTERLSDRFEPSAPPTPSFSALSPIQDTTALRDATGLPHNYARSRAQSLNPPLLAPPCLFA